NSLILKVNPVNTLYETPLTDVIDIETMGKNVQLSFHIDDTFGATQADRMMDMTFSIPNTFSQFCGVKGSTPAIEFKKKVMSMDCVRLGGKDPVATFERLIFLSPRGAYDMHINLQFFGLKNDDTAVTLLYRSIVSMHILPKLAKDKLNNTEDVKKPVEIQMKDELYASKFKDKLKKSYEGRVHEIVVSILEGLSGKKHSEIGEYGHGVWSILKAAHQSKRGSLYPLEDAFYFLSDPVTRIFYNDIKNVEIEGPEDGSFNLQIILNTERHCFSTLVESELDRLVAFMKVKNITVNFCEDPVKKSKGFKNFKKTMEKVKWRNNSQESPQMKNLWIEASAEEKDLYELTG
ncbi:FACT complex subunit SSRP1, partial [Tanacetum coccineum]